MESFSQNILDQISKANISKILSGAIIAMFLVNLAIAFRDFAPIVTTPLIFLGLIFIPGFLFVIFLQLDSDSRIDRFLYALGLGIAFWIIGGLFVNWILPFVGVKKPLELIPVWIFFDIAMAVLMLLIRRKKYLLDQTIKNKSFNKTERWLTVVPSLFVLLSVIGSAMLNAQNNLGGTIIMLMLASISVYVLMMAFAKRPVRDGVYLWGLWCASLALLLMYSMRSSHILGWDINSEYQIFQITSQSGYWTPNQLLGNREYNTCLSITILPTILANFLPIPPEYIFKLIFQFFFSFVPVIVFALSRRYFSGIKAFLAGFLFLSQTWFFEQMPAVIRQEIALVFFGLAILAIFDVCLKRQQRTYLFLIFSFSIVLSHYSTSYIWLAIFSLVLTIFSAVRIFSPSLRILPKRLTWKLFLALFVFIFFWDGVVTNVGNSFAVFVTAIPGNLAQAFSSETFKENLSRMTFSNPPTNTSENLLKKYNIATEEYKSQVLNLYDESTYSDFTPRIRNEQSTWPASTSEPLSSFVLLISRITKVSVVVFFTFLGVCCLLWDIYKKKNKNIPEFLSLCIATIPIMMAIIFLPVFHINYDISRLFIQTYIILSITSVIGGMTFFRIVSGKKSMIICSTIIFCVSFLSSTGFTERIFGGPTRITLDQSNNIFEPCYIHDADVASVKWLNNNYDKQSLIYADPSASLRIYSFTQFNENIRFSVFPSTITRDGYVYMSKANIEQGIAYASLDNNLLTYTEPIDFIEDNKNLIYNNGESKIYR